MALLEKLLKARADGFPDPQEGVRVIAGALRRAEATEPSRVATADRAPEHHLTIRSGRSDRRSELPSVVESRQPECRPAKRACGFATTNPPDVTAVAGPRDRSGRWCRGVRSGGGRRAAGVGNFRRLAGRRGSRRRKSVFHPLTQDVAREQYD